MRNDHCVVVQKALHETERMKNIDMHMIWEYLPFWKSHIGKISILWAILMCGSRTSGTDVTWELAKNANSQAPP